jgi:hypothetical protein
VDERKRQCTTFLPQDPNVPFVERERCAVDRPHRDHEHTAGVFPKYTVERIYDPDGKHADCAYFVLDPQHDPLARKALLAYAVAADAEGLEKLARGLQAWVRRAEAKWLRARASALREGRDGRG